MTHIDRYRRSVSRRQGLQSSRGFSLLEVLVAMTITGLALGSIFGVIAGNKRLAWRSEQILLQSIAVRSLINASQLEDEQGMVPAVVTSEALRLDSAVDDIALSNPDRKTRATRMTLRGFAVEDEHGEVVVKGSHWVVLELPE